VPQSPRLCGVSATIPGAKQVLSFEFLVLNLSVLNAGNRQICRILPTGHIFRLCEKDGSRRQYRILSTKLLFKELNINIICK